MIAADIKSAKWKVMLGFPLHFTSDGLDQTGSTLTPGG
jgi:hypothetical protein